MADDFGKVDNWLTISTVKGHLDQAIAYMANAVALDMRLGLEYSLGTTHYPSQGPLGSPIEAIFEIWFYCVARAHPNANQYEFLLARQVAVEANSKNYRFDFVVHFGGDATAQRAEAQRIRQPRIAIELDGHEFHERTKEQVERRNQRDRDLQADGWVVFHFSGSELYRKPVDCVDQVLDVCMSRYIDWLSDIWRAEQDQGG